MTVTVTYAPSMPKAGDTVTFEVTVSDDGPGCGSYPVRYGDGEGQEMVCDPVETLRFGPWAPPPREPRQTVDRHDHVYEHGGQYTATFEYKVGDWFRNYWNPYADSGSASVTVTVAEPSFS
ncbi:MAG: DUF11 domain-containing protein [Actinomycetota bacterium]|nr:DUF11 domain-containing protein [Actinomycetota bacterium]